MPPIASNLWPRVCTTPVVEQLTYEAVYTELQQIVQELQGETVSIDDLAAKIARAQELIRFCRTVAGGGNGDWEDNRVKYTFLVYNPLYFVCF